MRRIRTAAPLPVPPALPALAVPALVVLVVLVVPACTVSIGDQSPSPTPSSSESVATDATEPSPSPSEAALPNRATYEGRVEGKFRGAGLFSSTVTMVPRCRKGGECDVVGDSPKGGYKFEFAKKSYSAEHTFRETCSVGGYSTPLEINVQYKFRIARAKYIDDTWRATALKVVERVNSPGARQSFTSSTAVNTISCEPYHEKNRGTMVLAGRY